MDTKRHRDGRFDHTGRLRPVMVERIGRQAVAAAVRGHKDGGRDIYYTDAGFPGYVIREAPDGCRELLEEDADGELRVVRTLDVG